MREFGCVCGLGEQYQTISQWIERGQQVGWDGDSSPTAAYLARADDCLGV